VEEITVSIIMITVKETTMEAIRGVHIAMATTIKIMVDARILALAILRHVPMEILPSMCVLRKVARWIAQTTVQLR
jgi:hypothetical protein